MSPELFFLFTLAIKMAVAAVFVIGATIAAERAGPLIGGLIATLPLSAGPAYVFLALDHPPEFIAAGATVSLAMNVVTGLYGLAYVLLAQRAPLHVSIPASLSVWLIGATIFSQLDWSPLTAALANVIAFPLFHLAARPYRDVRMPRMKLRPADFVLRAGLVAVLVALVVTLSFRIGPHGSGLLAVFPVVYTSIMVILKLRAGGPAAAAVIASGFVGLAGFGAAVLTLQLAAVPLGTPTALCLALAVSILWSLAAYAINRGAGQAA